jgi:hypothetical protein
LVHQARCDTAGRIEGIDQIEGRTGERLNALRTRFGAIDGHCAVPRTKGRPDFVDPFGCDADGIAAAVAGALCFEQPRPLFFGLVSWTIVTAEIDIQSGMGKGAETFRQLDEARAQKLTWHRVPHFALKSDLDRCILVEFAVTRLDREHGMNQFVDEHT